MAQMTTRAGILRRPQTDPSMHDRRSKTTPVNDWQNVILRPELAQIRRQEVIWTESLDRR
ncbi:hypothetical protein [Yoonia sp. 2307UL14-13]|uniref:hypothetical protein n=1 Tax=Yoonia sp. 2307UL14-13 TaxID=3126506 RepID=UPI0030B129BD